MAATLVITLTTTALRRTRNKLNESATVLQCVVRCCYGVLQGVSGCCRVLQNGAVCFSVLQCGGDFRRFGSCVNGNLFDY